MKNLQELYEHEDDAISGAEDKLLDNSEATNRDMQFFNTTFQSSDCNLRKEDWDEWVREMASAKSLAAEMTENIIVSSNACSVSQTEEK